MAPNAIFALSGHRPDKLEGHYSETTTLKLRQFALAVLRQTQPSQIMSGLAQGWDQAGAWAATVLKIPWYAAIPCDGQESRWPGPAQKIYHLLLARAAGAEIVSPGPFEPWKMNVRNQYMANWASGHNGACLSLWNGTRGGTGNMLGYCGRINLPVLNCWNWWLGHGHSPDPVDLRWKGSHPQTHVTEAGWTITYKGQVIDSGPANSKFRYTVAAAERNLQYIEDAMRTGTYFAQAQPREADDVGLLDEEALLGPSGDA